MDFFFFFKQKTAYEMVGSDWSSDVCSSDLQAGVRIGQARAGDPSRQDAQLAARVGRDVVRLGVEARGLHARGQLLVELVAAEHAEAQLRAAERDVEHAGALVVAVIQEEVVDDVD